ncbi:protein CUSTOS [Cyprinodon tularosa]|uniref:protein CUSTOS n=1 Tax=Cyprinodon tularosa TaxID=77115 RepID=UPI0018E1DE5A|nr:protein CUSTOS [Cyprinodon tularosa]
MASGAGRMVRVSSESSSSDDEELKRCREAVWDQNQNNKTKDVDGVKLESKRVVVAEHDHDGNELQVTQGFRTHVAKKLEHLLDSFISETQPAALKGLQSQSDDEDDEGFRLFSTSVPGQEAAKPSSPPRCRPPLSSSDSDSEMETRLKEAAVSITDLLPPATHSSSSAEPPASEVRAKKKRVEEEHRVKKKKKRNKEEEKQEDSECSALYQSSGEQERPAGDVRRKKKKKHKKNTEEESPS